LLVQARMLRWSLSTALIALLFAGCDVPLDGLRDPPQLDAGGSTDAEPDAYSPPTMLPVDSGGGTVADAGRTALKDGSEDSHDAHAIDASAPDSGSQDDAGEGTEDDGS
jgi:hypothetical protein